MSAAVSIPSAVAELASLKAPALVGIYNELTGATVKKFKHAPTALKRTTAALELHLSGGDPKTLVAKAPKAPKAPKAAGAKKTTRKGEADTANSDQPKFRPDSNRGKVIIAASTERGARWSRLKEETGWEDAELSACLGRIKQYTKLEVEITGEGDARNVKISGELRTRKPFAFDAKKEQKTSTDGSKRAKVLSLLTRDGGATFEQIQKATEWNARTAYEGIRLIHSQLGYGLRETQDGHIIAFGK